MLKPLSVPYPRHSQFHVHNRASPRSHHNQLEFPINQLANSIRRTRVRLSLISRPQLQASVSTRDPIGRRQLVSASQLTSEVHPFILEVRFLQSAKQR
ncbi:hypothetical protein F2Q68_00012936 [Brassica cretica]|uniref:Uncharacterized protein n=1 Tax=Brassica cretica TaxID=69181 RepID=A0A8S9HVM8_BRACR|nr:hypothetical protein F2Q68_00012936 [Brassica cretica]